MKFEFVKVLKVVGPKVISTAVKLEKHADIINQIAPTLIAGIAIAEKLGDNGANKKDLAKLVSHFGVSVVNAIHSKDHQAIDPDEADTVANILIESIVSEVNKHKNLD
jgi:hypothetical protein